MENSKPRILEVQALYEGTPQQVQHFRSPRGGQLRWQTVLLMVCGLILGVGGAVAFGTQLYSVRRQEIQRAKVREFVKERGLPEHFVPGVHTNRSAELGGTLAFAGGLFLLLLGAFRAQEERRLVAFTIGEDPRADYATPVDGLPAAKFPLMRAAEGGFWLRFTSAMDGFVKAPGQAGLSLFELARTGAARSATGGVFEYRVVDGAQCRVVLGGNTFCVGSVEAGEEPERSSAGAVLASGARRPIALTTGASAAVVLAFLMLFQLKPAEAGAMETDSLSQQSNRRLRVLVEQARKDREPQQKEETKKPPPDRPREPVKTASRSRASDDRILRRRHSGQQGQSTSSDARAHSRSQGSNVGVVAVLTNMRHRMTQMIAYHTAAMSEAEDALTALEPNSGPGAGDSWLPNSRGPGPGGPAVVGPPGFCRGSHCNGNPWTDGVHPWSVTGPVPLARNIGKYRPKDPVVPQAPEHVEGIDAATIRRYMRIKRAQFRYCYVSQAMVSNPRAQGTVKVSFIISKSGVVLSVKVTFSSLNHRATEQCVARTIRRIKFPKTGGGAAFVTYPIRFRAVGRR